MSAVSFDTCFLIALEREIRRGDGDAHRFLREHASARPWISWIVVGEFAEGFGDVRHPACAAMLSRFEILPMGAETADCYARIAKSLRRQGNLIRSNDLWIAAASLAAGLPLVTNNAEHFGRVAGLDVVPF